MRSYPTVLGIVSLTIALVHENANGRSQLEMSHACRWWMADGKSNQRSFPECGTNASKGKIAVFAPHTQPLC